MMTKDRTPRTAGLKMLVLLPAVAGLLFFFSCSKEEEVLRVEAAEMEEDMKTLLIEKEKPEEEQIFVIVEDMPTFQGGGVEKFRAWVNETLSYPEEAAANGEQGRVYVQFVVETDGSVSNVEVIRGVSPALDEESIRTVKNSPDWEPGKQRGVPVRVKYMFPILFQMQ